MTNAELDKWEQLAHSSGMPWYVTAVLQLVAEVRRLRSELYVPVDGLDMDLLEKLARGEGGRRTGALMKAGLVKIEVTEKGMKALEGRAA